MFLKLIHLRLKVKMADQAIATKNRSPLRYPGGKTRACKALTELLNESDLSQFTTIISPFFGGGSFEFHVQNTYKLHLVANDKFTPLANFWTTCKNNKAQLCADLRTKINAIEKADFLEYRKQVMDEPDILKQSVMYFIINRCSFSGATLSGGFSAQASKKRFTSSSIDRISQLDLSYFNMYNLDFEEFISNFYAPNTLMFLDPPYYLESGANKLYGNNGDMHENFDHQRLFNTIKGRSNWMLTYNNCDYIKDLYKDFRIVETSWSYGMNKSKKSSEIVILNF